MVLGRCMEFLNWIYMSGVLFFFAALSALSFPCMPMWLGIQVRMMLLFLERVFILSSSLMIRGVDESLLCRACSLELSQVQLLEWGGSYHFIRGVVSIFRALLTGIKLLKKEKKLYILKNTIKTLKLTFLFTHN